MGTTEKSLGPVVLFRWTRRLLAWGALALLIYGAQHAYFQVPLVPVQPSCYGPNGVGAGQRELTGVPSRRFIGAVAEAAWRNGIPLGVQGRQLFVPPAVWLSPEALFDLAADRFFARRGGTVQVYDAELQDYVTLDLDARQVPPRYRCALLQNLAMEAWTVG